MSGGPDLTAMRALHDALRRDAEDLARITVRVTDDPRRILPASAGWQLFKKALRLHHGTEDAVLWPAMRRSLAGRPADLALLAALEAEHAGIAELVDAVDVAVAEPDPRRLGDLADALVTGVHGHLRHEEDRAFPLIGAAVTAAQWHQFEQVHAGLVGADAPRLLPWLLDGADPRVVRAMLAPLPAPDRAAFHGRWQPAYAATARWGTSAQ